MLPITLKIVAADGRIRQAATAEGPVHLIYRAPYEPGDRLVLDAGAPGRHLVVQLEDTMPPALLYGAEAQLCFPVPFGDAAIVYSPKAFSGDCHVLRARVEEIRLTLRADFPHDSWWTAATAAFSDGSRERLSLRKTAAPQTFVIPPRTVTRLTLCELQKADDESPFPALTQLEVWGSDTPM